MSSKSRRLIEFDGRKIGVTEAAEEFGVPLSTLLRRLNRGWSAERALKTPARGGRSYDLSGNRFGHLVAIRVVCKVDTYNGWLCRCDCGTEKVVKSVDLKCGKVFSCGGSVHRRKHGLTNTPEYRSWTSLRSRCNNPNDPSYSRYGALGVKVHPRWDKFENFLEDMGSRPEGTSIDRINPFGDYEPGNCRWADPVTQANNKRHMLEGKSAA